MLPPLSRSITHSSLVIAAESCHVPRTHQARNTLPCISLVPSLPSKHEQRVHHFLQSPAKTLPALKPLLGQGTFICWLASHLKESFSQKVKVQGVRILKFSLLALHSQENTALLKGRGASKPREQQPRRVLLPTSSKPVLYWSGSYSTWGCQKGIRESGHLPPMQVVGRVNPSTSLCSVFKSLFTWLWGAPTHTLPSHQNLQLDFILYIDIYVKYSYYLCK